ncbi:MAG: DUF4142 domain-containing protein [Chloroflexota bacterium]
MIRAIFWALAVLALPAAARAETKPLAPGNPAGAPAVAKPAPMLNAADRAFLQEAMLEARAGAKFGRLAEQKGVRVKEFGRRMAETQEAARERLSALAQNAGVSVPATLDKDRRGVRSELGEESGAAFDRAYLEAALAGHQMAAQLLAYEIGSGEADRLKAYAADALPGVLRDLQEARGLFASFW